MSTVPALSWPSDLWAEVCPPVGLVELYFQLAIFYEPVTLGPRVFFIKLRHGTPFMRTGKASKPLPGYENERNEALGSYGVGTLVER